jgi:hypothetical protein
MKLKPWTIALLVVIILDAFITIIVGEEENWMIVWVMKKIDMSLTEFMILKVLLSLPVVMWLDRTEYTKFTVFAYVLIYFILVGCQFAYA